MERLPLDVRIGIFIVGVIIILAAMLGFTQGDIWVQPTPTPTPEGVILFPIIGDN